jgi:PST family polysaccharide transporter
VAEHPGDVRSNEELTEAAASGLRWVAYARVGIELTLLASMVLLARLIPPAEFGIFAVVVIVHELAVTMPMEGIGSAMVQRRSIGREHLQGGLVLSLAVGIVLTAVTLLLAVVVVDPIFGPRTAALVMATTPYFLMGAIYAAPMAVLRRRLDFRRLSLVEVALSGTRVAATVGLAVVGLDAEALVFGSMAGMAVALLLALAFAPVPLPRWRTQAMRDLLPYGGPAALATVAWTGFRNGDYAIIGATLGPAQAGFYWRGYQLAVEYQRKISVAMSQMAFPILSRAEGAEAMFGLRRRMVRLLTVTLFPLLVTLAFLAPELVPWLFGAAWEPAVVPTQILALGGASTLAIDACGSALLAAGRSRAVLTYGVGHFVVYAGAVVLVAGQGLTAVAIAASAVHTLFLAVAYAVLFHTERERWLRAMWVDLAPATVACAGLAALASGAEVGVGSLDVGPEIHMAAVAAAAALGYFLTLRTCFPAAFTDLAALVRRVLPRRAPGALGRLAGPISVRARAVRWSSRG